MRALVRGPGLALGVACLALGALSLLLPSAPTYDPWAWIQWGREVSRLDLDTVAGPSWKPLPVLLTTPFSLAGDAAPYCWLAVARAGGLLAIAMAYRVAARLAGPLAGVVAAAALLLADGWVYTIGLGNSEGLLVAFVLAAFLRHLDGRRGQALSLAVLAALLRPEAWPFLGLYAAWLWWAEPERRPAIAAGLALVPTLWFLPELWGSGELLRSSTRASTPDPISPAFADRPALAVGARFASTVPVPALAGLALAVAFSVAHLARGRRGRARDGAALYLLAGGAAWLALVAVMTEAGFSGNYRYLLVPVGAACVLGGVGFGRLARAARGAGLPRFAVPAALLLITLPFAPRLVEAAPREAEKLAYEASLYRELGTAVARVGGSHGVLACGSPVTGPYQVPGLAWRLDVHGIAVRLDPREAGVVFQAAPVIDAPPEPRLDSGSSRLRPVTRAGPWKVFAACRLNG